MRNQVLDADMLWGERTTDGAFLVIAGGYDRKAMDALAETFGSEIRIVEKEKFENLLVGVTDTKGEYICMAIIREIDFKKQKLTLLAPLIEPMQPAGIRLGNLRVRTGRNRIRNPCRCISGDEGQGLGINMRRIY